MYVPLVPIRYMVLRYSYDVSIHNGNVTHSLATHAIAFPTIPCVNGPSYFRVYLIITTRKQSLGQGNIFTGICLFTGGGGRLLDRDPPSGQRHPPRIETPPDRDIPGQRSPCTVKSGPYASYWNAFLFTLKVHLH